MATLRTYGHPWHRTGAESPPERVRTLATRQISITDDLEALLAVLPPHIREAVERLDRRDTLLEVVMDLGRVPEARFTDGTQVLPVREVTREDLAYVAQRVGRFGKDNRAGICLLYTSPSPRDS